MPTQLRSRGELAGARLVAVTDSPRRHRDVLFDRLGDVARPVVEHQGVVTGRKLERGRAGRRRPGVDGLDSGAAVEDRNPVIGG